MYHYHDLAGSPQFDRAFESEKESSWGSVHRSDSDLIYFFLCCLFVLYDNKGVTWSEGTLLYKNNKVILLQTVLSWCPGRCQKQTQKKNGPCQKWNKIAKDRKNVVASVSKWTPFTSASKVVVISGQSFVPFTVLISCWSILHQWTLWFTMDSMWHVGDKLTAGDRRRLIVSHVVE